jgi:hypothetical protein
VGSDGISVDFDSERHVGTHDCLHHTRQDKQVYPYDLFHDNSVKHKGSFKCAERIGNRPDLKIKELVPDLTPGLFCGNCNAECFLVCLFLLA